MMQGRYYLDMYNTFNDCQYCFSELSDLKATKETKPGETAGPVAAAPKSGSQVTKEESQIESGKTAAGPTGPGSIFGPIDEIRRSIQRYRDKFVFGYDKALSDQQAKDYDEFISKQDNQMDPVKEDIDSEPKKNRSRLYLVFVKVAAPDEGRMKLKGTLFFNLD